MTGERATTVLATTQDTAVTLGEHFDAQTPATDYGDDARRGAVAEAVAEATADKVNERLADGCRWDPWSGEVTGPAGADPVEGTAWLFHGVGDLIWDAFTEVMREELSGIETRVLGAPGRQIFTNVDAADELGVPVEVIDPMLGDADRTLYDPDTGEVTAAGVDYLRAQLAAREEDDRASLDLVLNPDKADWILRLQRAAARLTGLQEAAQQAEDDRDHDIRAARAAGALTPKETYTAVGLSRERYYQILGDRR